MTHIYTGDQDVQNKIIFLYSRSCDKQSSIHFLLKQLISKQKTNCYVNPIFDITIEIVKRYTDDDTKILVFPILYSMCQIMSISPNDKYIIDDVTNIVRFNEHIELDTLINIITIIIKSKKSDINTFIFNMFKLSKYYNVEFDLKKMISIHQNCKNDNIVHIIEESFKIVSRFNNIDPVDIFECLIKIKNLKNVIGLFNNITAYDIIDICDTEYIKNLILICEDIYHESSKKIIMQYEEIKNNSFISFSNILNVLTTLKNINNNEYIDKKITFRTLSQLSQKVHDDELVFVMDCLNVEFMQDHSYITFGLKLKKNLPFLDNRELKNIVLKIQKYIHKKDITFVVNDLIDIAKHTDVVCVLKLLDNYNELLKIYNGKQIINELKILYASNTTINIIEYLELVCSKLKNDDMLNILKYINKLLNKQDKHENLHFIFGHIERVSKSERFNFVENIFRSSRLNNKSITNTIEALLKASHLTDIHQYASLNLINNYELICAGLYELQCDILDYESCVNYIKNDISCVKDDNIIQFDGAISLEHIIETLQKFLDSDKFKSVLPVKYNYLQNDISNDNVTGEFLFRISVTYVSIYKHLAIAFLVQGLWESIIAYDVVNIDNASCINGIAERFVTWFNNSNKELEFIENIKKEIYFDKRYEEIYYFDDDDYFNGLKKKYSNVKSFSELKDNISQSLILLYNVLKTEMNKKYNRDMETYFARKDIQDMFFVFGDDDNVRFEEVFEKMSS